MPLLSRILSVSFCLLLSTAALAQPLTERLPDSTLLYTGWSPDASAKTTKTARMLADERLIQPWRLVMQKLLLPMSDDLIGGPKPSETFSRLVADAARCEGCFALLELKPDVGGIAPQAVLILKLGDRRADFEEHFKPIHARLKERLGDRLHMIKLENSWLWMKSTRDKSEFTWGFLGDTFVFYFGDQADKFLPTLSTKLAHPLKDSPAFVDCMGKVPGDSLLTTYVDLKNSFGLIQDLLKTSNDDGVRLLSTHWQEIVGQLGLDNIQSLGEKTSVQGEQFVTRSLLRTQGPPHGVLASLVQPSVDEAMLKAVPMDATFVAAGRLDVAKFYGQIKAAAIAVAGEDGRRAFGDIEDSAAGFGVPVKALLDPLGDQWVVYEAASTGGILFTGLTLVVDVKDPNQFGRVIVTLRQLLAGQTNNAPVLKSYDVDGVTIQYLQASGGFLFPPLFTPAWAVADKKLVIALYPQVVEDAIRQFHAGKSLLDHPHFTEALKQTGGGGPLFYLSGPEFVRNVYPIALPFISALRDEIGIPDGHDGRSSSLADLLPSLHRLLQYVGSDCISVKLTPDGILATKSVANPLLSPLTLTDAIPLWVAAALPSMGNAKTTADRARSAANLRQIGQALALYANENKGKLPPDLATVLKTQNLKKEVLESPFGEGKENGDYSYPFVDGMTNAPADIVVIHDASELAKGDGAGVLYGDGHVDWLDRDGVAAALDKAAKWRKELKPKGN